MSKPVFECGNLVRHRVSREQAVVIAINEYCTKHQKHVFGSPLADCELAFDGTYSLSSCLDRDRESVHEAVLELVSPQSKTRVKPSSTAQQRAQEFIDLMTEFGVKVRDISGDFVTEGNAEIEAPAAAAIAKELSQHFKSGDPWSNPDGKGGSWLVHSMRDIRVFEIIRYS